MTNSRLRAWFDAIDKAKSKVPARDPRWERAALICFYSLMGILCLGAAIILVVCASRLRGMGAVLYVDIALALLVSGICLRALTVAARGRHS